MMSNRYYSSVIFGDIYAQWQFGETWFIFDRGGGFLFTIESPRGSTIADIKAKCIERHNEWENEK